MAMQAVIDYLKTHPTPTSERAHEIIDEVLTEHGCESPERHIVTSGIQSHEPHEEGTGLIEQGVPIVIDIYPRSTESGYFADMTRTVCIGTSPFELQRMYGTVLEAQNMAISMLAPGVRCSDVHNVVAEFFINQGYETNGKGSEFTYAEGFVHALGHGVSTKIHDKPTLSPKSEDILQEGDVITIEPGLYYKHIGGIRIEDMFVITETGVERITQFPHLFQI